MEKLERCRNQDNNPDSQTYKRKLQEILDEEDETQAYKQGRFDDHVVEGISEMRWKTCPQTAIFGPNKFISWKKQSLEKFLPVDVKHGSLIVSGVDPFC